MNHYVIVNCPLSQAFFAFTSTFNFYQYNLSFHWYFYGLFIFFSYFSPSAFLYLRYVFWKQHSIGSCLFDWVWQSLCFNWNVYSVYINIIPNTVRYLLSHYRFSIYSIFFVKKFPFLPIFWFYQVLLILFLLISFSVIHYIIFSHPKDFNKHFY